MTKGVQIDGSQIRLNARNFKVLNNPDFEIHYSKSTISKNDFIQRVKYMSD